MASPGMQSHQSPGAPAFGESQTQKCALRNFKVYIIRMRLQNLDETWLQPCAAASDVNRFCLVEPIAHPAIRRSLALAGINHATRMFTGFARVSVTISVG